MGYAPWFATLTATKYSVVPPPYNNNLQRSLLNLRWTSLLSSLPSLQAVSCSGVEILVRYWVSKLVAVFSAAVPIPEAGITEMDPVVSFFCQNSLKLNRSFHRNDNASQGTAAEVVTSLLGNFFWAVRTLRNMKIKIWIRILSHSFVIYGSWKGHSFTLFSFWVFYSVGFYLSVWISLVSSFL